MQPFKCIICKKSFQRYPSQIKNNLPTCSKICRNIKFKTSLTGKNNPNFNNKWSCDERLKQSELVKSKVDENYKKSCAKANKGKVFSKERIDKMHSHRLPASYSRKLTEASKIKIGIKSKEKFTLEYKQKTRQINEKLGYWILLKDIDNYKFYRKIADWINRMYDLVDGGDKIKQYGIFNVKNNTKGIVRDHIYSRKSGFENNVFPEILRHPVNCQLLLHADNVRKKKSRYVDADNMTLDELFNKILAYEKNWTEQSICVNLIDRYKKGERYSKEEYINKYYEHKPI